MSLSHLTKQFAQQAIGDQVKDVVDSLRPGDADSAAASLSGENIGAIIIAQVQAMQKSLKEDQELIVHCATGLERLRVLEIYAPSGRVVVLTGIGADKIITRVICPVESLQLICKPMQVEAGAKPTRVRFVSVPPAQTRPPA